MRSVIVLSVVCACASNMDVHDAHRPELAYPRIATYLIDTHVADSARAVMARSDLVIVDVEASAHEPASLDELRRVHPGAAMLAYLTSEEIPRDPSPDQPLARARFARVPPQAWLVEPGSTLTTAITANATELHVADPGAFSVHRPHSDFYGADEPTYVIADGEHMRVVSITGDTLTVERGYRSQAVPHAAGVRVASHVVFFAGTWMLDLAANAPVVGGRTWRDQLIDEAAGLVARGPWSGVFLDDCFEDISWLNGGLVDLDRDGIADDPRDSSRQWSAGMGMLVDALRAKLGDRVPIVSNPGAQDCPHARLDGILLEGWPIGMPARYLDFTAGAQRYDAWSHHGPHLTIANGFSPAIGFGTIAAGRDESARADYRAMRFGLGAALMSDGLYTYDNGVFGHYVTWWYDEYDGAGLGDHWLGRALGPPHAQGELRWREFEHGLAVVNLGGDAARFVAPLGFRKLAGSQDPAHNDGRLVVGTLAIAGHDAYVLRR